MNIYNIHNIHTNQGRTGNFFPGRDGDYGGGVNIDKR